MHAAALVAIESRNDFHQERELLSGNMPFERFEGLSTVLVLVEAGFSGNPTDRVRCLNATVRTTTLPSVPARIAAGHSRHPEVAPLKAWTLRRWVARAAVDADGRLRCHRAD
jgi:hypothetical protein